MFYFQYRFCASWIYQNDTPLKTKLLTLKQVLTYFLITSCLLALTLSWVWWGRCEKNYLPKEEGREGGEKKRAQHARRARGSNPGPAAC